MTVDRSSVVRAARIVGLSSFETPTLEAVDRRRFQLWLLTLLLLISVVGALVLFTSWWPVAPPAWMTPRVLRMGLLGLVVLFSVYAIEKELQLRRLTALLIEEKVLTAALTNRLREIRALLEAGRSVNLDLELAGVLDTILRCAMDLLSGRDASIMLVVGASELRTVSARGESAAHGARVRFGVGVAGRVAMSREPLLVRGTVEREARVARPTDPPPPDSALSIPLIHRDQLLGVLNLNASSGRTYTEHDLRALSLFGEQAAAALANAQLYEEQRLSASQSTYRALHDPLTRLPNRSLFLDRVAHALVRRRQEGERVAVLFLDLNDFKRINDSLGHSAGDEVLVACGERIRRSVRSGDTVARFGGDEFAVLVEEIHSPAEAAMAAERIRTGLADPVAVGGRTVRLSATLGIALDGPGGTSAAELLRSADTALHVARARGKGGLALFEESMRTDVLERLDLETELDDALQRNELEVHYQPILVLASHEVIGVEALVRWNHPRRGLLPAAAFVPLAEEAGMLEAIDFWTLERACETARCLPHRRCSGEPLQVNVNLLPTRLEDETVVEKVAGVLQRTGLEPERLVLEITENAVLNDAEMAASRLSALRFLGVGVALDDFGTGYSSLSYLRHFPVTSVKIDRIFIDSLSERKEETGLLQAIIKLGLGLSLEVVAEGVERPSQLENLLRLGCHQGQGYLFAPPLAYSELCDFLASGGTAPEP